MSKIGGREIDLSAIEKPHRPTLLPAGVGSSEVCAVDRWSRGHR